MEDKKDGELEERPQENQETNEKPLDDASADMNVAEGNATAGNTAPENREGPEDDDQEASGNRGDDTYRILIYQDTEKEAMVADVPELPDCRVVADTYEGALAAARDKIMDVVAAFRAEGKPVPKPIDERKYERELSVEVSPWLQRELEWQASKEKVEKQQIVSEILAEGLARRKWRRHGKSRSHGRHDGGRRGRRDHGNKNKSMDIMEDRASFIEYVRGLDSGGGGGGGHRGGQGGRGGKRRR